MADRVKRSVSLPPHVDAAVAAAAKAEGLTYSGWLARVVLREIKIRDGLAAMAEYEAEHGAFTPEELAQARAWADQMFAPPATASAEPAADLDRPPGSRAGHRGTPAA